LAQVCKTLRAPSQEALLHPMGCANSTATGAKVEVWACQYCGAQFANYQDADYHEKHLCTRAGGQVPGHPPTVAGTVVATAVAPPAAVKPQVVQGYVQQPGNQPQPPGNQQQQHMMPQHIYNQQLGMTPAVVSNQPITPTGRKRALLVGINYYGTRAELRGCINDVQRMNGMLRGMYGFNDIKVLTDERSRPDERPSRANILAGLRWLVEGAQPGDCFFFHYSGHGAQQKDPTFSEEDGYDETICPEDFQSAGMIVDDEIYDAIVAPLPSGAKLTAIMDCCHSGTGLDLPFTWEYNRWVEDDNPCHSAGDVLLVSGCQDSQCSSDGGGAYGRPAGAMTTALCNTLERNPILTLPQLLEQLREELRRGRFDQIPQLTSSQSVHAGQRQFSLTDEIVGNTNEFVGRKFTKKKHPKRQNLLNGGLGDMLAVGALGFAAAVLAPDLIMGGVAAGGMLASAGGDLFGAAGGLLGGGLLGGILGGGD